MEARAARAEDGLALVDGFACLRPEVDVLEIDLLTGRIAVANKLDRCALDAIDDFAVPVLLCWAGISGQGKSRRAVGERGLPGR